MHFGVLAKFLSSYMNTTSIGLRPSPHQFQYNLILMNSIYNEVWWLELQHIFLGGQFKP